MKKVIAILVILALLILAVLLLSGWPANVPDQANDDSEFEYWVAMVESVDIQVRESFPVQVSALVKGDLRDGCEQISEVIELRDEDARKFTITITTKRPIGQVCTQALVPFERNIALNVVDLPAGTYAVLVNDVRAEFTLEVDNSLPAATDGALE